MPGFGAARATNETAIALGLGEHQQQPEFVPPPVALLQGAFESNASKSFLGALEAAQEGDKLANGTSRKFARPQSNALSCASCSCAISDSFYFRTSPECAWHANCLSCSVCPARLDAGTSCFVRNGTPYCSADYRRLFSRKCSRCDQVIDHNEYVMLVKELVFHTKCFACVCCKRALNKGECFALLSGANLYCQSDYETLLQTQPGATNGAASCNSNNAGAEASSNDSNNNHDAKRIDKQTGVKKPNGTGHKGRPRKRKDLPADCAARNEAPMLGLNLSVPIANGYPPTLYNHDGAHLRSFGVGDHASVHHCLSMITQSPSASENSQKQLALANGVRQKRMRTSFKHHQLRAMKAYFNLNHNPDARDLKQLSEKTGLSKRVLQVWFQNSRAKYRRSVLKHQQDNTQWKDGQSVAHKLSPSQDDQSELGSAASRDNANVPINPMDAVDQILAQEKGLGLKDDGEEDDDVDSSKDGSVFSNNYDSLCSSPAATRLNVSLAASQPTMTMFACDMQNRAFING